MKMLLSEIRALSEVDPNKIYFQLSICAEKKYSIPLAPIFQKVTMLWFRYAKL